MVHKNFAPVPPKTFSQLRRINDDYWVEALDCPETVLETAAGKISLLLLDYCAYYAPDIAYEVRHQLSSKRRAIVLSHTIEMAGIAFSDEEVKFYLEEIGDSMINHAFVWKRAYGDDWSMLCNSIQKLLGVDFGKSLPLHLLQYYPKLPPEPNRMELRQSSRCRVKYPKFRHEID